MRGELETGRGEVVGPRWAMQKGKDGGRPGPYGAWAGLVWADGIGFHPFLFLFPISFQTQLKLFEFK